MANRSIGDAVDTQSIGGRLRMVREMACMSGRDVDRLCQLSSGHTGHIERGQYTRLSVVTISTIAKSFGLSCDWLILGRGAPPSLRAVRHAVMAAERHQAKSVRGRKVA